MKEKNLKICNKPVTVPITTSPTPGMSVNLLTKTHNLDGTKRDPQDAIDPKVKWLFRYEGELIDDIIEEDKFLEGWITAKENWSHGYDGVWNEEGW